MHKKIKSLTDSTIREIVAFVSNYTGPDHRGAVQDDRAPRPGEGRQGRQDDAGGPQDAGIPHGPVPAMKRRA